MTFLTLYIEYVVANTHPHAQYNQNRVIFKTLLSCVLFDSCLRLSAGGLH